MSYLNRLLRQRMMMLCATPSMSVWIRRGLPVASFKIFTMRKCSGISMKESDLELKAHRPSSSMVDLLMVRSRWRNLFK